MRLQACTEPSESFVEKIERIVRLRTGGMIRGLRVSVVESEVVITGRATTYYTKQLATHAAMDAVQDLNLSNDIEVH